MDRMNTTLWYPPNKITFSQAQMLFLLENLDLLGAGDYPPDPYSSDEQKGGKHSYRAPFVTAIELSAEVTWRLGRTGVDGKLLLAEAKLGLDIMLLSYEAKRALKYCSGWRRKKMDYRKWQAQNKYRQKEVNDENR